MSRIGKKPIAIPGGVNVTLDGQRITVKGPKGELSRTLPSEVRLTVDGAAVTVERISDEARPKAMHGLSRTLVANMVEGVSNGFVKALELHGVGYKAEAKGKGINLVVGLSHQVQVDAPGGIAFKLDSPTLLKVEGIDKELVGQVAAEIRNVRPPEPYKGKGIRYQGEQVRRKAGKTGAK